MARTSARSSGWTVSSAGIGALRESPRRSATSPAPSAQRGRIPGTGRQVSPDGREPAPRRTSAWPAAAWLVTSRPERRPSSWRWSGGTARGGRHRTVGRPPAAVRRAGRGAGPRGRHPSPARPRGRGQDRRRRGERGPPPGAGETGSGTGVAPLDEQGARVHGSSRHLTGRPCRVRTTLTVLAR
ncbi:hypothetical protein QJS66_07690 [Kocuria rhizophila]|nr:hypothetical protein QJS66_07690 [Kocuria rhizophila]